MSDKYVTKLDFSSDQEPKVVMDLMKAVIVRDRTGADIDPNLDLCVGGRTFGEGVVVDVKPLVGYGNGYFKIGERGKMVDKRTARRMLKDLGLSRDEFNEAVKVTPLNGVVVWFAYQPVEAQEVEC